MTLCCSIHNPGLSISCGTCKQFLSSNSLHIRNKAVEPGDRTTIIGCFRIVDKAEILFDVALLGVHEQIAGICGNSIIVRNVGKVLALRKNKIDFLDSGIVPVVLNAEVASIPFNWNLIVFVV